MLAFDSVAFTTRIERKSPDLPRYFVLPSEVLDRPSRTFMTYCALNGAGPWRRSVKDWGDGRWFVELKQEHARAAGVEAGDEARVELSAAPEWPEALVIALREADLYDAWSSLPRGARRMAAERVFEARRAETANARIERILERVRACSRTSRT